MRLDIDERELKVGLRVMQDPNGQVVGQIFISDSLENGAGYSSYFGTPAEAESLLRLVIGQTSPTFYAPLVAAAHASVCQTSCPDCLRDFSNLPYHNILDWRLGLDLARLSLDSNAQIDFSIAYWQGVDAMQPGHTSQPCLAGSISVLVVCKPAAAETKSRLLPTLFGIPTRITLVRSSLEPTPRQWHWDTRSRTSRSLRSSGGHSKVDAVGLPEIKATSPTLAEIMRLCLLRAGLSRANGSSRLVLGNPKAWLGVAYHKVLQKIPEVDLSGEPLEKAVERLWSQAIGAQHQRASSHPLDRRFGSPENWPGYYVARASVLLRAQNLMCYASGAQLLAPAQTGPRGTIREQEFTAYGGRLVGRPDVITASRIVDYKSGAVVDYDECTQAEVVRTAYIRQLRIYGYLVKETIGWCPQHGLLLPLAGAGVEVELPPDECEQEAFQAMTLLDSYNKGVHAGTGPEGFAASSPESCKWCPYKLMCPSFWQCSSPSWSGLLDGAALEGIVTEPPRTILGGSAIAISVDVQGGTEAPRRVEIAPLNPAAHANASKITCADRIRLVGLRVRPDGVLVPTQRTLLVRVADIPSIAMGSGE